MMIYLVNMTRGSSRVGSHCDGWLFAGCIPDGYSSVNVVSTQYYHLYYITLVEGCVPVGYSSLNVVSKHECGQYKYYHLYYVTPGLVEGCVHVEYSSLSHSQSHLIELILCHTRDSSLVTLGICQLLAILNIYLL